MNNEDFVSYEIAQALKKAGFDYPCKHYYTKEDAKDKNVWLTFTLGAAEDFNRENKIRRSFGICSASTLVQAQKWLREVKGIDIDIRTSRIGGRRYDFAIMNGITTVFSDEYFPTYESALSAGIEAALKLIEEGEG